MENILRAEVVGVVGGSGVDKMAYQMELRLNGVLFMRIMCPICIDICPNNNYDYFRESSSGGDRDEEAGYY